MALHLLLGIRILVFKLQDRKKQQMHPEISTLAWSKSVESAVENKSLTDLTTSLGMVTVFALSMLPANIVNEMDPNETSKYPNYLIVYFMHLAVPLLMAVIIAFLYYLRNPNLREAVKINISKIFK